jgi:hypothetical protein
VTGVQQDKDAVLAGLTLPWSNGPVEGQVNRLKLIKRSMYGRAKFDLLKLRVLHHDKKSLERKNKKKQAQQEDHLKTPRMRKKNITLSIPPLRSAKLRKIVRIVSSKQVFPPGDEEEGEILYNLRIDVGCNPQPCVN